MFFENTDVRRLASSSSGTLNFIFFISSLFNSIFLLSFSFLKVRKKDASHTVKEKGEKYEIIVSYKY